MRAGKDLEVLTMYVYEMSDTSCPCLYVHNDTVNVNPLSKW